MVGDKVTDEIQGWSDLARCAYQKIEPIVGDRIANTVIKKGCQEAKTDPYKLSREHLESFATYIAKIIRIYDQLKEENIKIEVKNCGSQNLFKR